MCRTPDRRNHHEVLARGETLMAGASGKDHYVAGAKFECAAAVATEPNFGAAARDPQHLVNARVIVQMVVDAIAPAVASAVVFEEVFHNRSRIKVARQLDGIPVNDDGPSRVVRYLAVVAEAEHASLTSPQQPRDLLGGWALPAGSPLCRFLYIFQQRHGSSSKCEGLFSRLFNGGCNAFVPQTREPGLSDIH
jgi:hypothetical protein